MNTLQHDSLRRGIVAWKVLQICGPLRVPHVEDVESGIRLTRDRGDYHFDLTVRRDGMLEWFYDDYRSAGGERADGSDAPVESLPPEAMKHLETCLP